MKAKGGKGNIKSDIRFVPLDEQTYPVGLEDAGIFYWRIWCGKYYIVYEKYKNGVKLGHLILPDEKELFNFKSVEAYVEAKQSGEVMCIPKLFK